jgi:hypothetical protein
LRPGWPLSVLFLGFPIWWALGLSQVIFLIVAIPMAIELLRRSRIAFPPRFGLLVLFLVWMFAGATMLWLHAPGTLPDESVMKLVPFLYRAGWYLASVVVMLYVINLREDELPSMRVVRLVGFMFVVTTVGGLLGVVVPNLEFRSLLEVLLPHGVTSDRFISNLIHPSVASAADVLGYEQARPVAPFAFANAWGNNLALFLPFFLYGWWGPGASRLQRVLVPCVLLVATVPLIYSLNRGVWLGLGAGAVYLCIRLSLAGRTRPLLALGIGALVVAAAISSTSLGDTIATRLGHPHSNDRRGSLAETVIATTWEASPVVGFGSTRDLSGNFTSIAGASSPDCVQCAVEPLGTQGFLWRLVFTTGFVGALLFVAFLATQFWRHARLSGPLALLGTTLLLMSAVFFLVYDSLAAPLFTLMIGIGLMNRERLELEDA